MPTINEVNIPTITSVVNTKSPIFNIAAPAIIGTDNKNVNLVILYLDIPNNLPVRIVVPLRENPGIIAKA